MVPILWLVAAVAIPVGLMATRHDRGLLVWVVLLTFTDIGIVRSAVNVPALTIAGLVLLPHVLGVVRASLRSPALQWAGAHLLWLVFLGLAFGLAYPWPDDLGRPFNLQAEGRTLFYLTREIAAFSVAVFVGQQIAKDRSPAFLLRLLVLIVTATSVVAIAEFATGVSYYVALTEGQMAPTYWNLRVRGLNFEPRGLALVIAHAVLIALLSLAFHHRVRLALASLATSTAALFLSASTSGLVAVAAGVGSVALAQRRVRRALVRAAIVMALIGGAAAWTQQDRVEEFRRLLVERVGSTNRFGTADGWFQQVAYRMEIFDSSAVLFLAANPIYALTGTGPGLVPIPSSPYMPITPYTEMYVLPGLNSPPTMGWLLELSNGGVVGVLLWIGFVLASAPALRRFVRQPEGDRAAWAVAYWTFLGSAAIYSVAGGFTASPWSVMMGLGLGASFLRLRQAQEAEVPHAA
jgi:hypothetical protein